MIKKRNLFIYLDLPLFRNAVEKSLKMEINYQGILLSKIKKGDLEKLIFFLSFSLNLIFKETFIFGMIPSSISFDRFLDCYYPRSPSCLPAILLITIHAAHIMGAKRRRIKFDSSTGKEIQWSSIGSFIVSCQYFTTPFFRGCRSATLQAKISVFDSRQCTDLATIPVARIKRYT